MMNPTPSARTSQTQSIGNLTTPEPAPATATRYTTFPANEKRGVKRREKCGGSGWPELPQIQFEQRTDRPGLAVWFAPQGNDAPRNTKTYLGYVNKGELFRWSQMTADERQMEAAEWVASKKAGKGIG